MDHLLDHLTFRFPLLLMMTTDVAVMQSVEENSIPLGSSFQEIIRRKPKGVDMDSSVLPGNTLNIRQTRLEAATV